MEILVYNSETKIEAINNVASLDLNDKFMVKIVKKNNRTIKQNRALHLFFKWIAKELNDLGMTFVFRGLKGVKIEIPYTETLVKESIWKPIQKTLFDINSTRDLDTFKINTILDVLTNFFAESGVSITFPNKIDQIAQDMSKHNFY